MLHRKKRYLRLITGEHSRKGFSLIELLVTVAILGILAAMATANYNEYKRRANDAAVFSQIRSAVVAREAFYVSHPAMLALRYNCLAAYTYNVERRVSCSNGFPAYSYEELLPGFTQDPNVTLAVGYGIHDYVYGSHCLGTTVTEVGYEAYTSTYSLENGKIMNIGWARSLPADGSACP